MRSFWGCLFVVILLKGITSNPEPQFSNQNLFGNNNPNNGFNSIQNNGFNPNQNNGFNSNQNNGFNQNQNNGFNSNQNNGFNQNQNNGFNSNQNNGFNQNSNNGGGGGGLLGGLLGGVGGLVGGVLGGVGNLVQGIGGGLIGLLSGLAGTRLSSVPHSLSNSLNCLNGNFSEIVNSKSASSQYKSSTKPLSNIVSTLAGFQNSNALQSFQQSISSSFQVLNTSTENFSASFGSRTTQIILSSIQNVETAVTSLAAGALKSSRVDVEVTNIATSVNILFVIISIIFQSVSVTLSTISLAVVEAVSVLILIVSTLLTLVETLLALVSVTLINNNNNSLSSTLTGITLSITNAMNSITILSSSIASVVTQQNSGMWGSTISSVSTNLISTTFTMTTTFSSFISIFGNINVSNLNVQNSATQLKTLINNLSINVGQFSGTQIYTIIIEQFSVNITPVTSAPAPVIVPISTVLSNLGGPLSGLFSLFTSNVNAVSNTLTAIQTSNSYTSAFSPAATFVSKTLTQILQYSGTPATILTSIQSSITSIFTMFIQTINNYSSAFGPSTTVFTQILTTLQTTLTNITQNNTNLSIITASITEFVDYLGYYILYIIAIENLAIENISPLLQEALAALSYITFTIFSLIEYSLLIIVSITSNITTSTNINALITSISSAINTVTTAFTTLSGTGSSGGIIASIPLYTQTVFGYVNSIQNISNAFGNTALSFVSNTSTILTELQNVFNGPNFQIGNETGSQIFNTVTTQFPLIVPNILTNLSGSLSGQFALFTSDITSLAASLGTLSSLQISTSLTSATQQSSSIINQVLQYSGSTANVLQSFSSSLSSIFVTLSSIISSYSPYLGTNITNILLQELSLYQSELTNLIQNASNVSTINANVIQVLNSLEYFLITVITVESTVIANNVALGNGEVYISLAVVINTLCVLHDYAFFLVVPSITDTTTLNNISAVLKTSIAVIGSAPQFFSSVASSTTDVSSFTTTVVNDLPLLVNVTIAFIDNVQSVPNVFSNATLSLSNTATDLSELQTALSQVSGNIGNLSGSQIVNEISATFSVPNILLNLGGSLSGEYQTFINDVSILSQSFNSISNLSISSTLTFAAKSNIAILNQILQNSGFTSNVLQTFLSTFTNTFGTFSQIISNYSNELGTQVTNVLLQVLTVYQSELTSLIQGANNVGSINANIIQVLNSFDYLLVTIVSIESIVNTNNVVLGNSEIYVAIAILINTVCALHDYTLFLLAPTVTDSTTLNNLSSFIITSTNAIQFAPQYFTNIVTSTNAGNSFSSTSINSLPIIVNATITFIANLQSVPNIFSSVNLSLQNQSLELSELQTTLSQVSGNIGNLSGSQIVSIILSTFSVPNILTNLNGVPSGVFSTLTSNINSVSKTLTTLESSNNFTSSFSPAATAVSNILEQIIQFSGSQSSILGNLDNSISSLFNTYLQSINNYSSTLGSSAATFSQIISTLQTALTNMVQNSTNISVISSSVSELINYLGYLIVYKAAILNLAVGNISTLLNEAITVVSYITFSIFAIAEYVSLLIVSVTASASTSTNIVSLISSISTTLTSVTSAFATLSSSGVSASVPLYTQTVFGYVNSVENTTNVFGSNTLTVQSSTSSILTEFQNLFNGPNFQIGNETGSQIFNTVTTQFPLIVPNILTNLGGSLSGQFSLFTSDINNLATSLGALSSLQISTTLTSATQKSISIINQVLQYSGSTANVLQSFSSSLSSIFVTLSSIISSYSPYLGTNITNILLQELSLYQSELINLIQNANNVSTINANVIQVLNSLEYFLITVTTVESTVIANNVALGNGEVYISLAVVINTLCVLHDYAFFLVAPSITDTTTLNNISAVLKTSIAAIGSAPQFFSSVASSTTDVSSFTTTVVNDLPLLVNVTIAFINNVQSVPNVFSNSTLSLSNTATDLSELQTALSQVSGNIGNFSGSQVVNEITSSFIVPNILLNLGGSLNGQYQLFTNEINNLISSFSAIGNLNISSLLSFSAQSCSSIIANILSYSGSTSTVLQSFSATLPSSFATLSQIISNYTNDLETNVTNILLQELSLYETAITDLIKNPNNLSAINANVINVINTLQYFIISVIEIETTASSNGLLIGNGEIYVALAILINTVCASYDFILFLLAPTIYDATTLSNINSIINTSTSTIKLFPQLLTSIVNSVNNGSSFTTIVEGDLSEIDNAALSFIDNLQAVPNVFSNANLVVSDTSTNLEEIKTALLQLSGNIGNLSGSQIVNIVSSTYSVPNILANLGGSIGDVYNNVVADVNTVSQSLSSVISLNFFPSSSFSSVATFSNNIFSQILQLSGSPITVINGINSSISAVFNEFNQSINNYSSSLFGNSASTFTQVIATIQSDITTIIQNYTNLSVVNSTASQLVEYLGYYIVYIVTVVNLFVDNITDILEEAFFALSYLTFSIYSYIEYILLLVVSLNPTATSIISLLSSLATSVQDATNAFPTLSGSSSVATIAASLSIFTQSTFGYVNSVQNLTNAFGSTSLNFQNNTSNILGQLQNLLNEPNFQIGNQTGSQLFTTVTTQFPLIVPNILTNLGGSLQGQYELLTNDINNLASSFQTIANLNISPQLSSAAQSSSSIISQVLQYSGTTSNILQLFSATFTSTFTTLTQIISNYSGVLGAGVTNVLLQELSLYKNTMNTLMQNADNLSTINANVIEVINSLQYFIVTIITIEATATSNNVVLGNDEIYVVLAILINTICVLHDYTFLLLAPSITDSTTLINISSIINTSVSTIATVPALLTNIVNSVNAGNSFTATIKSVLPTMVNASITFIESLQSVPNVFSNSNLTLADSATDLLELQTSLSQLSDNIGNISGSQIVEVITSTYSVPNILIELGGDLSGQFLVFASNVQSLNNTFSAISNLNISPSLSTAAQSSLAIVNQVLQYSGSASNVLQSFSSSFTSIFATLSQIISNYSSTFGSSVSNILLQLLALYQTSLITLIQDSNDISSINSNTIQVLNSLEYLIITTITVETTVTNNGLTEEYAESFIALAILENTACVLHDFAFFLLSTLVSDITTQTNLSTIITNSNSAIQFLSQLLSNTASSSAQTSFATSVGVALPQILNATLSFVNNVQSVPNVFSSTNLSLSNSATDLAELQAALSQLSGSVIGNMSGSQIVAVITSTYSVPNILETLGGSLSGQYEEFVSNVESLNSTFTAISNLNISPSLSSAAQSSLAIVNQVLQISGSANTVLESFASSFSSTFATLSQIISSYSTTFGSSVTNILLQLLSSYQTSLTDLINESSNISTINANTIQVLNSLEYLIVTTLTVETVVSNNGLTEFYAEAFIALAILENTACVLHDFVFFLLSTLVSDNTTLTNLSTIIINSNSAIQFLSQLLSNTASSSAQTSFITSVGVALPQILNASLTFVNNVQSVPNVFSSTNLSLSNSATDLAELESALSQISGSVIGNISGSQIVAAITSTYSIPNILETVGGSLSGQYVEFASNIESLNSTFTAISNLNISPSLSGAAQSCLSIANAVLQYSGPTFNVLQTFSSSLPNAFATLSQIISSYSSTLGSSVTNILQQELSLYQTSLINTVKNATNVSTINSNTIQVLNSLEYILITTLTVKTTVLSSNTLTQNYAEAFIALSILESTICVLHDYVFFVLTTIATDITTFDNLSTIITNSGSTIQFISQLLNSTASSSIQNSFISSVQGALPVIVNATLTFISNVQSVPNVFSSTNLSLSNSATDLVELQAALSQLSGSIIGNISGSQIVNAIASSFSVQGILSNLGGALTGQYQQFLNNVQSLNSSFTAISNLNISPSLSNAAQSCLSIANEVLQFSGSTTNALQSFSTSLTNSFVTLNQIISSLSSTLGSSVTNILQQELSLYQTYLTNLVQGVSNVSNINANTIQVLNSLEYLLITTLTLKTTIITTNSLTQNNAAALISVVILETTTCVLHDYAFFLISTLVTDTTTLNNLSTIITNSASAIQFISQLLTNTASSTVQNTFVSSVQGALPVVVNATLTFINNVQSVPNVFSASNFTLSNPANELTELQTALTQLSGSVIGNISGSQIVTSITSSFSVPNTLFNLGGSLSGQYQQFSNNVQSLNSSFTSIISLNISSTLTSAAQTSLAIVNEVLQYSGSTSSILGSFSSSFSSVFSSLSQIITSYKTALGTNVTNVLVQELALYQTSLTNLVQNAGNVSSINSNTIQVLNSLQYLLLTTITIETAVSANTLSEQYAEAFIALAILENAACVLHDYAFFLLSTLVTDTTTLTNLSSVIINSGSAIQFLSQLISSTASSSLQSNFTTSVNTALPVILNATLTFVNNVKSVPNVFSSVNLSLSNNSTNVLAELQSALSLISFGTFTGAQIFSFINSSVQSVTNVTNVLSNLGGSLSGQYQQFSTSVSTTTTTVSSISSLKVSTTLSSTATSCNTITKQVLQFSGSTSQVLTSISSSLPNVFTTLSQIVTNYSNTLGSSVTSILAQELLLYQNALNNMIQNCNNVSTINANAIQVLNSLEYLLITVITIETTVASSNSVSAEFAEVFIALSILLNTTCVIHNYVFFLLVPLISNVNSTVNTVSTIIINSAFAIQFITNILSSVVTSTLSGNTFVAGVNTALPSILSATVSFIVNVQTVPNVFSSFNFSLQNSSNILKELQNALNQLNVNIGQFTGSQIVRTISSAYSNLKNSGFEIVFITNQPQQSVVVRSI